MRPTYFGVHYVFGWGTTFLNQLELLKYDLGHVHSVMNLGECVMGIMDSYDWLLPNVRGVPSFGYELAKKIWRFPNELAIIRTRYRLKIVKVGNWPVQMRKDRQYSRLRHHILGYLPSQFLNFRQVAEGTRDMAEISTKVILESWLIRSKTMEANQFRVGSVHWAD